MSSLLWNNVRWTDQVVLGWVVLEITDSAWHVAMVGALRLVPWLALGLAGGAVADRFDRRSALILAQASGAAVSLALAGLLAAGHVDFVLVAAASLLLGAEWAIAWPIRRALIPDLVGRELTPNAVALENVSMYVGRIAGPLVAGLMLAYQTAAAAFLVTGSLYLVQIALTAKIRLRRRAPAILGQPMLLHIREGFTEVWASRPVRFVLIITALMNVLAFPYNQLLPVFARDVLHVGAVGLGMLGTASGVGALVGALALAPIRHLPRSGHVYWIGSCLMCLCLAGFALSSSFPLALAFVTLSGVGQAAFSSIQTTMILVSISERLRGRALGALTLAIGSAPFGLIGIGALSAWLGAPVAVALSTGLGAFLVMLTASRLSGATELDLQAARVARRANPDLP